MQEPAKASEGGMKSGIKWSSILKNNHGEEAERIGGIIDIRPEPQSNARQKVENLSLF